MILKGDLTFTGSASGLNIGIKKVQNGTVKLQRLIDGDWVDVPDGSFTTSTTFNLLPGTQGVYFKFEVVSGEFTIDVNTP